MDQKITIVQDRGGEWIGLYVDGLLIDEGHSFSETRILDLLGIEYNEVSMGEWYDALPQFLEELKDFNKKK